MCEPWQSQTQAAALAPAYVDTAHGYTHGYTHGYKVSRCTKHGYTARMYGCKYGKNTDASSVGLRML